MARKIFVVTGATGHTGSYTVERLLERGQAVRALAHREDDRSQRLEKTGAEVVIGDLLKFNDVRAGMRGVRGAYFCYPIPPAFCRRQPISLRPLKRGRPRMRREHVAEIRSRGRKDPRYVRTLVGRTGLRLVRPHRRPPARLLQNSGIADAARTDRSDGRYRAGRRSSSRHPIRNGSPAKHYSSREVFVRHLQELTSTTRKEK
jgi:hypothetical protein